MWLSDISSLRACSIILSAFSAIIFSTNSIALPAHTLIRGEWALISLPADPGASGTVEALFADDLPASSYGPGGDWILYEFNAVTNTYRQVTLTDTLLPNTGYWMVQLSADSVTLDLPDSSGQLVGENLAGCPTGLLCSSKLLISKDVGQWNLVGASLNESLNFGNTRFQSDDTLCAAGCSPEEASSASLIGPKLYRYRAGQYETIVATSVLDPWDGLWMPVLPGNGNPIFNWLLPISHRDDAAQTCTTKGGKASESGLKTWCWADVPLPEYTGKTATFNNGELGIDSECNENQISLAGDELRFYLDPGIPAKEWCNNQFNLRAEILTRPWEVNNPIGTEEWFGWAYRFGDNYQPDTENPWAFFQVHHGANGSPPFALFVVPSTLYGAQNGEVVVVNHANTTEIDRTRTGVITKAGMTLDIVVHVIHHLDDKGLLQVWINGNMVYNKQVSTVYDFAPLGGNAKFGIYKWPWREASKVQTSLNQGIDHLETYMGPLRIITRKPWDDDYGENAFNKVSPISLR